MAEVQSALEEITGLLDVFLQGLLSSRLLSGYCLSLETCPEQLEPSLRSLPLLVALLETLQAGIKSVLLRHQHDSWSLQTKEEGEGRSQEQPDKDGKVPLISQPDRGVLTEEVNCDSNNQPEQPCSTNLLETSTDPLHVSEVDTPSKNSECTATKLSESQSSTVEEPNLCLSKLVEDPVLQSDNKAAETCVVISTNHSDESLHKEKGPLLSEPEPWSTKPVIDSEHSNETCLVEMSTVTLHTLTQHDDWESSQSLEPQLVVQDTDTLLEERAISDNIKVELLEVTETEQRHMSVIVEGEGVGGLKKKTRRRRLEWFECSECHREFKSSTSLEAHRARMHAAPHLCDLCGMVFGSTSALQEHCRAAHGGIGCFQCATCKKRFMLRICYRRHLETHEPSVALAVCEICGKSYRRPDYLQRHYKTHTGDRPHECPVCGKAFICSSHLKNHIATHSEQRGHSCEICGRGFSRSDKLKEHVLRHLNVKRHSCGNCGKEYAERRDLKKHVDRCMVPPEPDP